MKEALISDFNMLLYRTGHSFKYRVDVIKRALKKYEEKVQKADINSKPLYRDKEEMVREGTLKKMKRNKYHWVKSRGYAGTLNVPVTPGGELKDNISKRLEQMDLGDHLRLKIREVPGQLLSHKLSTVTDLNRQQNCERVNRMSCSTSSRGGSAGACWRTGPMYRKL